MRMMHLVSTRIAYTTPARIRGLKSASNASRTVGLVFTSPPHFFFFFRSSTQLAGRLCFSSTIQQSTMPSFSATFLLAVLAPSVLTTAAPVLRVRAGNGGLDLASQFAVACTTVNIAGNLTFTAIDLINKIKTNDAKVSGQLDALNATMVSAITAGEQARPVCEAPDPNNLAVQFATACSAVTIAGSLTGTTLGLLKDVQSNDQNVASQLAVLTATMNAVNTAGQFANTACAAGSSSSSSNNNDSNNNNASSSSNNNSNASANNNSNNNSNGNANASASSTNDNATANANNKTASAKDASSSTSTASKAAQTQKSSASQSQGQKIQLGRK
ncbi:hypothetical protein C8R46DRAFT_47258 [Mycena filopes]|nr:hypothetical protein C8R46DRAFT_47258 [Mycena filopes]